ncbi:putative pseudouridine synthase [Lyophyllum shimeji]|uniref:Pseudouridine synthase n=1 Tax=Lyophyllum shimeji TaxID=47721 RepID=A0A9P3PMA2_LYOSH|nr:putative pseudouridine synthase [Lyophyllum shimeji]
MAAPSTSIYDTWSREELIARLTELDLEKGRPRQRPPSPKRPNKAFDFATHPRRKIALKFCYSGWEYGGLAFQNMNTSLPTVEGVLFDALVKARLIDPAGGFEGCGWEKCGRTDRGVSAAGQVISLWVRSALGPKTGGQTDGMGAAASERSISPSHATPDAKSTPIEATSTSTSTAADGLPGLEIGFEEEDLEAPRTNSSLSIPSTTPKPRYEHDYLAILNRLLPPTIRIIAWSPVSDCFSARFSCAYRHYKYFFSSNTSTGHALNIDRMRTAASLLIGEHDFRNLCKLDPGKQITMFKRKVMHAEIEPLSVDSAGKGMYVFNLIGSAFLYHQVRHIMAVLFMVGRGQEEPQVVTSLMNVEEGLEPGATEVVDSKPEYQMADALPLMLWDCGYPEELVDWRTTNGYPVADGGDTRTDLYQQLHAIHERSQVYTVLNEHFLAAASRFHLPPPTRDGLSRDEEVSSATPSGKVLIPLGGGTYKRTSQDKYTPLLRRNRLDPVEVINERWRVGKGFRREERRKAAEGAMEDSDGDE